MLESRFMARANINLVEESRWTHDWADLGIIPKPFNPSRNYEHWCFHKFFKRHIKSGDKVLEVGCGGSTMLPYFFSSFSAEPWGFDYSDSGVKLAMAILAKSNCKGHIFKADLFSDLNAGLENSFDVVWSAGFIEHFEDTADCVDRVARFARPNGLVLTMIPNLAGIIGPLQKMIDPRVFSEHVMLSAEDVHRAHLDLGLEPLEAAHYFGTFWMGVLNYNRLTRALPGNLRRAWYWILEAAQAPLHLSLWALRAQPNSRMFSPYIIGAYRKIR